MTNFAPVAPLGILKQLAEVDALGNYQLLIAPIVLEREDEYAEFFLTKPDQFILLDNGVIEQGYAESAFRLYRAKGIVGADVIVLPDTIDDAKMTAKQVRFSLGEYRKLDPVTELMGVVQGTNDAEVMWCATQLVEAGVDWLGVPRGLTPNLGTRVRLVKALGAAFGKPMHVLGFSENIVDDIMAATAHPLVRGMDAATPVWLGFMDHRAISGLGYARQLPWAPPLVANFGRRPETFWSTDHVGHIDPIKFNLERVRGWLREPQTALSESHGASPAPI